jgi:hypothetical protein
MVGICYKTFLLWQWHDKLARLSLHIHYNFRLILFLLGQINNMFKSDLYLQLSKCEILKLSEIFWSPTKGYQSKMSLKFWGLESICFWPKCFVEGSNKIWPQFWSFCLNKSEWNEAKRHFVLDWPCFQF